MFFKRKTRKLNRDKCNAALDRTKAVLPPEVAADVDLLINEHNEWDVGIEMIIYTLAELDIKITQSQYAALQEAMRAIGQEHEDHMFLLDELLES